MTKRSKAPPFSLDDDQSLFLALDRSTCAIWYQDGKLYICTGEESLSLDPEEVGPFLSHVIDGLRHMLAAQEAPKP